MSHHTVPQKRAAVEMYRVTKKLKKEHKAKWLDPLELSSIAAGGASKTQIYEWNKLHFSDEDSEEIIETRGRPTILSEDQTKLLIGFVVSTRISHKPVSLLTVREFCISHLSLTPCDQTIGRLLRSFGFSHQKSMTRSSRLVSQEVVEEALEAIQEIRSYNFPPHRIIVMDETGLWSNVVQPRTYHFRNWYVISFFSS